MIKENQSYLNKLLILLDALSIYLAFALAWYIRFVSSLMIDSQSHLTFRQYLIPILFAIPIFLILYNFFKLYEPYRHKGLFEEFVNILKADVLGILILVVVLYLFKEIDYSRYLLLIFTINNILLATAERVVIRLFLRYMRKNGYNLKHALVVGYSDLTLELLSRLEANKHWGYNIKGILDDHQKDGVGIINHTNGINTFDKNRKKVFKEEPSNKNVINIVGKLSDLEKYLNEHTVDEVFITLNIKEYEKLGSIIEICEKAGVRTEIIPDYVKYIPARPYVEELDGLPIINIRYVPLDNLANKAIKRTFDILISLISIIIFSPIMLITAIAIKLTSPGPVIFKQERIGYNNKPFTMYKFRTMRIQSSEEESTQWTTANDLRKTKLGSFLRKTSLDELPQLFNVLKGDMSIVGPRPERDHFVRQFREEIPKYMVKHQVRPGITGWAQVNGWRGDTSIKKRIEFDMYYVENWDLLLDIKILWKTVYNGFVNKNAY